jgi:hypothetical protein
VYVLFVKLYVLFVKVYVLFVKVYVLFREVYVLFPLPGVAPFRYVALKARQEPRITIKTEIKKMSKRCDNGKFTP